HKYVVCHNIFCAMRTNNLAHAGRRRALETGSGREAECGLCESPGSCTNPMSPCSDRAGEAFGHVVGHAIRQRPLAVEQVLAERAKTVAQQLLYDAVAAVRVGADLRGERAHGTVEFVVG